MCSILFTTRQLAVKEIEAANNLLQFRGPDDTCIRHSKIGTFIHNRLDIVGNCIQPYSIDGIDVLFNGEIYNYSGSNEASFIIDTYNKHGITFAKYLDGEYAIVLVDNKKQRILATTDPFKTKPLWVSVEGGFHAATYKSALIKCDINCIEPQAPNTTLVYNIKTNTLRKYINIKFDLNQYKNTYTDWIDAFKSAIQKRSLTDKKIFIGLSSGYDSGCIACELHNTNKPFNAYSILNNENIQVINDRSNLLKKTELIDYSDKNNLYVLSHFQKYCELDINTEYGYLEDRSSIPLMHIGIRAKNDGCKIFFSGTGCDEIIGDYFVKGNYDQDKSSCFQGKFPENLNSIFPWKNFFNGTMRKYLTKDEYIIGCLGIEARYPFLDKQLVQEFLWLKPELKNNFYKAPLREYLIQNNFPYKENEKKGFRV
jgi:asparagine synthetase B (glutamine-hydrolysing)